MATETEKIESHSTLGVLWRGRWTVVGFLIAGITLAALYTWYRKPQFEGSAVILMPSAQSGGANSLAQQLGMTLPVQGQSNIYMFKQILESSRARKAVGEAVGLPRSGIRDRTQIEENSTANSILIRVLDTDRERALKITSAFLDELRTIHKEMSIPTRENQVADLEDSLKDRQLKLRKAEEELREFQMTAKTAPTVSGSSTVMTGTRYIEQLRQLELDRARVSESLKSAKSRVERAKGSRIELPSDIPTAKEWREKLASLEYDLRVLEISAGPRDPNVVKLREQIQITKQSLRNEVDNYVSAVRSGLVDPTLESGIQNLSKLSQTVAGLDAQISALRRLAAIAPSEAMQFQRLIGEVAALQKLVEQARVQLEQARTEAAADPNRWEVLDVPEVSEDPVNKDYAKNMAVGGVVSLVAGLALAFAKDSKKGP